MKLGPFEIRRHAAAEETPGREPDRTRKQLGASGTVNFQGFLQPEEYLPELSGEAGRREFERMRRSDPDVREALWHIYAPILNATWDVEAAGDDPKDLEAAALVRAAYFDWLAPDQPFVQHVRQALSHLALGFSIFELVEQVVTRPLSYIVPSSGDAVEIPARQYVVPRRFAQMLPRTISRWNMENRELVSITQTSWSGETVGDVEIPAEKLVLFVNEREGDDFNGVSILRSARKPWVIKEMVETVAGVAVERHGVGINVAYLPKSRENDAQTLTRVEEMLQNVRAGEFSYMVFPGPKAQGNAEGADGFTFEVVSPAGSLPDLVGFLEYLRGAIKGNVLARFAELGHGGTGARATGDVQSEVWYDAIHAVATYICDVHRPVIEQLVRKNIAGLDRFPRLVAGDIETRSLEEFANAQSKLLVAGAILPDRTYRRWVRQTVDAPDEDEDAEEQTAPEPVEELGGPRPNAQADEPPPAETA